MSNKRVHFLLQACDQWKSLDSMRVIGVFTLPELRKTVKRKIKDGTFKFEDGNGNKEEATRIDSMGAKLIDTLVDYCHITPLTINEEL
jgi:hypothetical protein